MNDAIFSDKLYFYEFLGDRYFKRMDRVHCVFIKRKVVKQIT